MVENRVGRDFRQYLAAMPSRFDETAVHSAHACVPGLYRGVVVD